MLFLYDIGFDMIFDDFLMYMNICFFVVGLVLRKYSIIVVSCEIYIEKELDWFYKYEYKFIFLK